MPAPGNKPSSRLTQEKNNLVFSLLGPKCVTIETTPAQLHYKSGHAWQLQASGVLCFVRNANTRWFTLRFYDLEEKWVLFEQDVFCGMTLHNPKSTYFYELNAKERMVGFSFAQDDKSLEEARQLVSSVRAKVDKLAAEAAKEGSSAADKRDTSQCTHILDDPAVKFVHCQLAGAHEGALRRSSYRKKLEEFIQAHGGIEKIQEVAVELGYKPETADVTTSPQSSSRSENLPTVSPKSPVSTQPSNSPRVAQTPQPSTSPTKGAPSSQSPSTHSPPPPPPPPDPTRPHFQAPGFLQPNREKLLEELKGKMAQLRHVRGADKCQKDKCQEDKCQKDKCQEDKCQKDKCQKDKCQEDKCQKDKCQEDKCQKDVAEKPLLAQLKDAMDKINVATHGKDDEEDDEQDDEEWD